MKKVLGIFLCIALLLGTVTMLASCQSKTYEIKVLKEGNNGDEIQVKVYAVDNADNAVDNTQPGSNGYTDS